MERTLADGMRAALPLFVPTLVVGISFGVAARSLDWGWVAPVVMSVVVFSGSAQFASTGVLAGGGSVGAAIVAAILSNLRFLPMGLLAGPATRGSAPRRALEGQLVVDASLVLAMDQGRVSRGILIGATIVQATAWIGGTAIGAVADLGAETERFGIDAVFPAFFLALLGAELRGSHASRARRVALGGGLLALALTPVVPPGIPVVAAALAAVLGMGPRD